MRKWITKLAVLVLISVTPINSALAQTGSWQVVDSSGTVRTSQPMIGVQLISTGQTLGAGAVLSTGADGRIVLARGAQQIVVGPNSRMALPAEEQQGMTRIVQDLGTLLFKVDKQDKQHFKVETPIIAAVVKGTTFTVTAGAASHSVHVAEGSVEVSARSGEARQLVTAGMTARVSQNNPGFIQMSNRLDDAAGSSDGASDPEPAKSTGDLIVPANIGTEALDFTSLSDGLVQPSERTMTGAQASAALGGEVSSRVRGEGGGAAVVQEVRFNAVGGNGAVHAKSGVGNANVLNNGIGNGNAGFNNSGNGNTGANNNSNVIIKADAGGNGNNGVNVNSNAGALGNGNAGINVNAGANANGNSNSNGSSGVNVTAGAGANSNGGDGVNVNADAGINGNGNAGVNISVDANANGNGGVGVGLNLNGDTGANSNGNGGVGVGVEAGTGGVSVQIGGLGLKLGKKDK